MKMNLKKGFTLIELLVVVAIIGVLASVVLASLNTARSKGTDAAIKSNLDNTRAQAALYYDTNSNYSDGLGAAITNTAAGGKNNVCTGIIVAGGDHNVFDPNATNSINGMITAAEAANGSATSALCSITTTTSGTTKDIQAWAVTVPLKSTTGHYWCVDSTGASLEETSAPTFAVGASHC
jgi:prepilin-type N-terminal cleavage/methylation domain-containing protein